MNRPTRDLALLTLPILLYMSTRQGHLYISSAHEWLAFDYAGRALVLVYAFAISSVRRHVFAGLGRPWPTIGSAGQRWVIFGVAVGLAFGCEVMIAQLHGPLITVFWKTQFFAAFRIVEPTLLIFDMTAGLVLVTTSEEILFRCFARQLFEAVSANPVFVVAASAVLFGLMHWPTGIANVIMTALTGAVLMSMFLASKSLWPGIVAHYIFDLWHFWPG